MGTVDKKSCENKNLYENIFVIFFDDCDNETES